MTKAKNGNWCFKSNLIKQWKRRKTQLFARYDNFSQFQIICVLYASFNQPEIYSLGFWNTHSITTREQNNHPPCDVDEVRIQKINNKISEENFICCISWRLFPFFMQWYLQILKSHFASRQKSSLQNAENNTLEGNWNHSWLQSHCLKHFIHSFIYQPYHRILA